jgi:hypothetical protein
MDSKLDEILKLVKDNNKMLHKIRRDAMYRSVLSTIWWLIVLISPIVLYYYYLEPYISNVQKMYSDIPGFEQYSMPTEWFPDLNVLMERIGGSASSASSTVGTSTVGQ